MNTTYPMGGVIARPLSNRGNSAPAEARSKKRRLPTRGRNSDEVMFTNTSDLSSGGLKRKRLANL